MRDVLFAYGLERNPEYIYIHNGLHLYARSCNLYVLPLSCNKKLFIANDYTHT